jgi:hypothetical protein
MSYHIDCTFDTPVEQVYNYIKRASSPQEILDKICYIIDNCIYMDYRYFKPIGNDAVYEPLLAHIINKIRQVLSTSPSLIVHVSLKGFSIREMDKHVNFFKHVSIILDTHYPQKLTTCYVYNASSIFTQLFSLLSYFIDKDTLKKMQLVGKS